MLPHRVNTLYLKNVFDPQENSLSFLRLFLAGLVVFSHSYPLGGFGGDTILGSKQVDCGNIAVHSFFILSGFLITRSYIISPYIRRFLWSRILRIFPGFWACLIFTILIFAPIIYFFENGSLTGYFSTKTDNPLDYLKVNFFLEMRQFGIAGILKNAPISKSVDGSLWTLIYEFKCYLLIALIGALGIFERCKIFVVCFFLFLWLIQIHILDVSIMGIANIILPFPDIFLKLLIYFLGGSIYFLFAENVIISNKFFLLALGLIVIAIKNNFYFLISPFILPYILLWLAVKLPFTNFDKYGDFSYGLYIYTFPIQQILTLLQLNNNGFILYFVLSILIGMIPAVLSYHIIEKPFLKLKTVGIMRKVYENENIKIIGLMLSAYVFIAFLSLPWGVGVGLDSSWSYAISRAAVDKFIFGKDIIFTYGPFGYLIGGSVLEQNFYAIFLFRLAVELITFIIIIRTILIQKTIFSKLLLSSCVFFSYLLGLSIDYKIVFSLIMIFSWDNIINKKNIRLWALMLGSISGFCVLTKFNTGVCTLGIVIIVISARVFQDWQSKLDSSTSLLALLDTVIASLTSSFLLFNYNLIENLKQVLLCIFCSAFLGVLIIIIKNSGLNKLNLGSFSKQLTTKITFKNSFYLAYTFGIFSISFYLSPQFRDYLRGSFEISSGYSSAMSIVGSQWELGVAIVGLILVLLILLHLMGEYLGLGLALAFTLWMSFKHGYVRQDSHVYVFITSLPIISSIAIIKLEYRYKFLRLLTLIYLLIIILIYCLSSSPFGNSGAHVKDNLVERFSPTNVTNKVSTLLNPEKLRLNIIDNSNLELSKIRLPDQVLQVLNNKTIDIIPWEISLIKSNRFNYQPRPIFQSYSAYTKFLDHANLRHISTKSPDYIIYQFSSIDNRHPFFDEPSTFSYVACNYKLSSEFNQPINIPLIGELMILRKRNTSICSSSIQSQELLLNWNQVIKVPNSSFFTRVAIKFEYSLLGKIYKTIFRAPPVDINVGFKNGSHNLFRIIPENSENGIIISHLPLNTNQVLSLFQGKWDQGVKSFNFSTINPIIYKPNIQIKFDSYKMIDSSIKDISISLPNPNEVNFVQEPSDEYIGSLDTKNTNYKKEDSINLNGWVVSKSNPQQSVFILVTDGTQNIPIAITQTGNDRQDVGIFFKNRNYNKSGWSLFYALENKKDENSHVLKTWVYDPVNKTAKLFKGNYSVIITQAP